ncbi:MAG: hypothetical protein V1754_06410 [Pseudomonadota bacterium]
MNLHKIISTQLDPELGENLERFVQENLPEFKQVFSEHPLKGPRRGCVSLGEAFWLFHIARAIQPEVIIESGNWEGYSLYFLWRAVPQAKLYAFDPLRKPEINLAGVEYHAYDWTKHKFMDLPGERTLVFFDDHMHQGKRLQQALARGVRHVLFHDNYRTPYQSPVPIRYCNLLGMAKTYYIFDRLRSDPFFCSTEHNPQAYRWLTYLDLETNLSWLQRLTYRLFYKLPMAHNPYERY